MLRTGGEDQHGYSKSHHKNLVSLFCLITHSYDAQMARAEC